MEQWKLQFENNKWKHQKQWTYSTSFVLNHNLDGIRQGKLFLMYQINRSTAVIPASYLVRSSLIPQEFKVVDPCLITRNSKTGGVRWTGTSVSEMPFDKQRAPYQLST